MPPTRGLFLERTWRLHPDLCAFTSEVFYEGKLQPKPGLERQRLTGTGVFSTSVQDSTTGVAAVDGFPFAQQGILNRGFEMLLRAVRSLPLPADTVAPAGVVPK